MLVVCSPAGAAARTSPGVDLGQIGHQELLPGVGQQFEKELIRERTMAGLAAARARGRVGGRPTVWTQDKLRTARSMRDSGDYDVTAIAKVLGVSRASVYRALGLPTLELGISESESA